MGFPRQEYWIGLPFLSPAFKNIWQQSRLNTGNKGGSKEGKESEQVINSKTTHWEEHVHNLAQFSSLIVKKKSKMNYFCQRKISKLDMIEQTVQNQIISYRKICGSWSKEYCS